MSSYAPLTNSQQLILLGQQLKEGSPMNNMGFKFTFRKEIDVAKMQLAFGQLIMASDALRATVQEGRLKMVPSLAFELPFRDLHQEGNTALLPGILAASMQQVFDLQERLFDAALYKLGEANYVLYFNQHHLITDGWSFEIQLRYLLAAYEGRPTGELPSFRDYCIRNASADLQKTAERIAEQWRERVEEYPQPPQLYGRNNVERNAFSNRHVYRLSASEMERLVTACSEPEVRAWTVDLSVFNVVLAALYAYICRVSGQYDLTVGAPAHNRITAEDKQTPGLFMELLPIRAELAKTDSLAMVLKKTQVATMEFLRQARPGASSAATGNSFNVLLNFINRSFHDGKEAITSEWLHSGETEPGYHLKVQVYDFDATGRWTFCFDFNDQVVPAEEQQNAVKGFFDALWQMTNQRNALLLDLGENDLNFLAAAETKVVSDYPHELTVLDLFDRQKNETPDEVVARAGADTITYAELAERAGVVATVLQNKGIGLGDIVPICLDRSLAMIVGLLGIMKAGAAYLPIEPGLPGERIAFLLQDAGAKIIVVETAVAERLSAITPIAQLVLSPVGFVEGENVGGVSNQLPIVRPQDLMYVIYTSGSTGTPKGVMNQYTGVVNSLEWGRRLLVPPGKRTVFLQKTTFTFDVSVWELFLPLISRAELVMARKDGEKDALYLRNAITEYGVTTVHFVPSMLELFLDREAELPSLKTVFCSGEGLLPHQVNKFKQYYPEVALHNLYGPTEAAIHNTHWQATTIPVKRVPIGAVGDNGRLRIYGNDGNLVPVGVPGELFLGGVQVARGYLNRPALNAEKFVQRDGERWYRTGDLVRWLPDGDIEFLGRIDNQIKLRGFRIELGEVEAHLLEADDVSQAVVILGEDMKKEPALLAYLVGSATLDVETVRQSMARKMPAYMLPSFYVTLKEVPLLQNGKIDRKALPEPEFEALDYTEEEAPQGEIENMVHECWSEIFQRPKIGRKVDFFELGGHSLTAIRLVGLLNRDFELELSPLTVFRYPTIELLAGHVEATIRALLEEMED